MLTCVTCLQRGNNYCERAVRLLILFSCTSYKQVFIVVILSEFVNSDQLHFQARMLITEHNLLEVILNTFLEECAVRKNSKSDSKDCYEKFKESARLNILNDYLLVNFTEEGKIAFDKNERNQKNLCFKRAQYMLYDLKYVTFDSNKMYSKFYTGKIKSTMVNSLCEMIETRGSTLIFFLLRCLFQQVCIEYEIICRRLEW